MKTICLYIMQYHSIPFCNDHRLLSQQIWLGSQPMKTTMHKSHNIDNKYIIAYPKYYYNSWIN